MTISEFEQTVNEWGRQRIPFLFVVDFELEKPLAFPLDQISNQTIRYDINGIRNAPRTHHASAIDLHFVKHPISFDSYRDKFEKVLAHLSRGDSYLTNLTISTEIESHASLEELFEISDAKYKLLFQDQFLVFSPEIFVRITDDKIFSYPMKGTISAAIPNAENVILQDEKELAEHVTIVDLIRNDLSLVAENVSVTRFRYLDEIKTNQNHLFQVSSEITGSLNDPFDKLGTLLVKLLPAGSVSGAPKPKTTEIIRQAEQEARGYYTGVMGIFNGTMLDSGVMIRYIEKRNGRYYYRSGGGITTQSDCRLEYQEAIEKIYVPIT
jgi:para-aminobenzoate synthetase component I